MTNEDPTPATATPAPEPAPPTVDFTAMDEAEIVTPKPKNGTYLAVIRKFEPVIDPEAGIVTQWKFTLEAAEAIPDSFGGHIGEGSRLGTYSMFVSQSQYRALPDCIATVKRINMGLNNVVIDLKKDPRGNVAKTNWKNLDERAKRPAYLNNGGALPALDGDLEFYAQHEGTLVQVRLATKPGAMTNLVDVLAKDTPRETRKN